MGGVPYVYILKKTTIYLSLKLPKPSHVYIHGKLDSLLCDHMVTYAKIAKHALNLQQKILPSSRAKAASQNAFLCMLKP